jgi:hypothetical protein
MRSRQPQTTRSDEGTKPLGMFQAWLARQGLPPPRPLPDDYVDFPVNELPRYTPTELQGILEDMGCSDPVIDAQLREIAAQGRLTTPLIDPRGLRTLTLAAIYKPPVERFILGRMFPKAKASVLFGPTGAGKSPGSPK